MSSLFARRPRPGWWSWLCVPLVIVSFLALIRTWWSTSPTSTLPPGITDPSRNYSAWSAGLLSSIGPLFVFGLAAWWLVALIGIAKAPDFSFFAGDDGDDPIEGRSAPPGYGKIGAWISIGLGVVEFVSIGLSRKNLPHYATFFNVKTSDIINVDLSISARSGVGYASASAGLVMLLGVLGVLIEGRREKKVVPPVDDTETFHRWSDPERST